MDCHDVHAYLPFLGDGSLDPVTEHEVEMHLDACGVCRAGYDAQQRVLSMVQAAYPADEPEQALDMLSPVWHGIRARKLRRRLYRIVVPAAAVVLIAVGVHLWGMFTGGIPGTSEVSEIDDSYYTFLSEEYITLYDIVVFGENLEVDTDYGIDADFLLESGFFHMTMDDIIEHFDSDEISKFLQMASY
ncbi:anti-sigma factor family protein [Candidatus Latescibacterota bacterium]